MAQMANQDPESIMFNQTGKEEESNPKGIPSRLT